MTSLPRSEQNAEHWRPTGTLPGIIGENGGCVRSPCRDVPSRPSRTRQRKRGLGKTKAEARNNHGTDTYFRKAPCLDSLDFDRKRDCRRIPGTSSEVQGAGSDGWYLSKESNPADEYLANL